MQKKGEKESLFHGDPVTTYTKESGVKIPHMLNQSMMWSVHEKR